VTNKDDRAVSVDKGKTGAGYRVVRYRDAKGTYRNARVLGQGGSSGLKLLIDAGPGRRIVDNVALGTADTQTNVYFSSKYNV
jgi:hypothetical protein